MYNIQLFFVKIRSKGSYGAVSVVVVASDGSALRNLDYRIPASGVAVQFDHNVNASYIRIPIVNDDLMEYEEYFTLKLLKTTAGARIGRSNTNQVNKNYH